MLDLARPVTPLGPLEADMSVPYLIVKLLPSSFESIKRWCTDNSIVTRLTQVLRAHNEPTLQF